MSGVGGATALVTGAGSARGIGRAFVQELNRRDARRIYAADLAPEGVEALAADDAGGRIVPLALDVTDELAIAAAAARCADVDLLINNAGVCFPSRLIGAPDLSAARREMEVNYWGMLAMCRAFAPVLAARGGGAIVNVSSIYGLVNYPYVGSYSASKAANASLTQGIRAELRDRGTLVVAVYPGTVDTELSAGNPSRDKTPPEVLAATVLDGLERGEEEIFVGPDALDVAARLATDAKGLEREYAGALARRLDRGGEGSDRGQLQKGQI